MKAVRVLSVSPTFHRLDSGVQKPSWSLASASPGPSGRALPCAPPPTAPGVRSPKPRRQRPHPGLLPSAAPRPLT